MFGSLKMTSRRLTFEGDTLCLVIEEIKSESAGGGNLVGLTRLRSSS